MLKHLSNDGPAVKRAGAVRIQVRDRARRRQARRVERLEERALLTVFALPDVYGAVENTPLNVTASGVLANDSDNTATSLHVSSFVQPSHGSLTMNSDGTFVYTPSANYTGADSFSYTATDGVGGSASATVNLTVEAGQTEAYLFAGPRLASVSSSQSAILNSVLGGLTGSTFNLTAADWTGLSQTELNGGAVAQALQAELGVSSPSQALTTNATLQQIFLAEATVAQADGDTAQANALNSLATSVQGLSSPVQLGDLLQINPNDGSLADSSLNALDLVTGEAQLYNAKNVATTPTPVTISPSALGLPASIGSIAISSQVVEPPIITGGPAGTQFHSAAIRLKMDLNLSNTNLNLSGLSTALAGLLGTGTTVTTNASLNQLTIYTEVAEGQGTITSIDAISDAVNLQATPGLANVYIGNIADSVFFDRNHVINPATDLNYATVGTINISTKVLGVPTLNATTGIQLKSYALGQAPSATNETFTPPYPQTQTVTTGASFISNLTTTLVNNLSVKLSGSLGVVLDPLVNGTILPAVKTAVAGVLPTVVTPVLTNVADPTLQLLGTGLGELILTVTGVGLILGPVANTDYAVTLENSPITLFPLSNDAVATGDTISLTSTTNPAHGTLTLGANNAVTYTPANGYFGTDSFTYTITDSLGLTSTATVNVKVEAPPVAVSDSYNVIEGNALNVAAPGVLSNDDDPAGQPLSSSVLTQPAHGTLTFNADGSFVYTPNAGYFGSDSFTYRDSDGTLNSNTATVTINVQQAAPIANNDSYNVTENTPLTVAAPGVLANDSDPSGLPLTASVVGLPLHGTVVLNANGSFTYTPFLGYFGSDSFTYQANDGTLNSNTATVSLTISQGAPTAANDSYNVAENTPLIVTAPGVLSNDSDPSGLPLSASVVTNPGHGTLTLNANGSFTYTPTNGYFGTDTFTYRDSDGTVNSNTATVTLNIGQSAPTAGNDTYTVNENNPLVVAAPGVLANDSDPSGQPLTVNVVTGPAHGTLTLNPNGSFTYTPANGYFGVDGFTYRANDGTLNSNTATVTINVQQSMPAVTNDSYTANENTTLNVAAPGVLGNDSDPSGLPLTATLVSGPTHGTLVLNSNGSFSYTPTIGYFGADSFTYRASDGILNSSVATVSLTVQQGAPTANNDTFSANENTPLVIAAPGVLANDSDPSGLALSASVVTAPTHGTLTLNANGSFTYTPAAGYFGTDSFTYRDSDGTLNSNNATVAINVSQATPTATNDSYTVTENRPLTIAAPGVLGNDTDPSGLPLTASVVTNPLHGTLVLNADGSLTYTPSNGYFGTDGFSYRANDGNLNSNTATVTFTIPQSAPVAANDTFSDTENTPLNVAAPGVLANDSDPSGLPLTSVLVNGPAHGTLTFNSNGSFVYTPNLAFFGTDSFTYKANDGVLLSAPATVTINVGQGAPVANNDIASTTENTTLNVAAPGVLANDVDPSGFAMTAVLVTGPSHGSLTLNSDGSYIYTPANGYLGTDTFSYRANDGTLNSNTATVTITVALPAPPAATPDSYSVNENGTLSIAAPGVLGNDTDPAGLPLSASVVTNPLHGTLTLNSDGSFTYTPNAGYFGTDGFSYQASDGSQSSAPTAVALAVNQLAPIAFPDTYNANEGTTLTVAAPGVLSNDSDPSGLPLTAVLATGTVNGTVTLNPDGSFVYVPNPGTFGTDTFSYWDTDGTMSSNLVTVTLNVAQGAPVANNDFYIATEGTPLSAAAPGVLGNDADPSGFSLVANLVGGVSHGTLVLNSDGSFTYTPTAGYSGPDSFTYQANDGTLNSNTATVTINVAAVAPPVAVDDAYNGTENTPLVIPAPGVLSNDLDPSGRPVSATVVSNPAHGTLTLNSNGSFTYVPQANYVGADSFTYSDSDGINVSNTATVSLNIISSASTAPIANNDTFTATEGTPFNVAAPGVLGNDVDPSGLPLTAAVATLPAHGTLTLNADGSFTYVPAAGYTGTDTFTYTATDGSQTSSPATVTLNVLPSAAPPVANPDFVSLPENSTLTVSAPGVLGNDISPSGQPLTAFLVSNPAHGTLVFHSDGSYTYTPASNYVGSDSFSYQNSDGSNVSNPTTVTITVNAVALPPTATADSYSLTENNVLTVSAPGVTGNDISPSGQPLTSALVSGPSHGTLSFNADGSFTYVPDAGYVGLDAFFYKDSDGTNNSNTAAVNLTINAPPASPTANNDSYAITSGSSLSVPAPGVLANDSDPNALPLSASLVSGPAHGTLTFRSDGSFTYVPNAGYVGADSFSYRDSDGTAVSNAATVSISVNAPPSAPAANNDTYVATANTTLIVSAPGVLGNDSDPNGLSLTAVLVTEPSHGVLTFNPDGSFTYAPAAGYTGNDSFTYKAADGVAISNTATVSLIVNAAPAAPVANNDAYTTTSGTALTVNAPGVLANDTDPSGNPLTAVLVTNPLHGTLVINPNGSFTYTPANGYTGSDSFSYRASNGNSLSNAATVSLTVNAAPLSPTANNDTYGTTANTTLTVAAPGVLGNDTDPNGLSLTSILVTGTSHGVLTFNSDGSLTYAPNAGYTGSDSFTYKASDGLTLSNTATVTVIVGLAPPAPVAVNDSYSTTAGHALTVAAPGVLSNDSDPSSLPMSVVLVSNPSHGVLAINPNGSFVYTPAAGFAGSDSFTYRDSDGTAFSAPATVTITVNAAPQSPVANNDTFSTAANTSLTVAAPGVLGNDTDPNGLPMSASLVSAPAHGTLTFNSNGSFTYAPSAGFTGSDSFSYQAADSQGVSNVANVTIVVNLGSQSPVANDDAYGTNAGTVLTVAAPGVLGNDSDPNGRSLTATLVALPSHGTVVFNSDGSFTYAPAAGYTGPDSFTYKASDGIALSNTATISITINAGSTAPIANNDVYAAVSGHVLTIAAPGVLSNDSDPSGRPLNASLVSGPSHGVLSFNSDGSFVYTPAAGFTGSDSFSYRDSDGAAISTAATVTINVSPATQNPVANNDAYATTANTTLTVAAPGVLGNDTDPNGRSLSSILVTSPSHGVLTFNSDGSFSYAPAAGYVGSDSFTYKASDGQALSNTATISLTIGAAGLAPVANNDAYATTANTTLTVAAPGVLGNDTDPNGRSLSSILVTSPSHGVLTFNSDGSFSYAPAAGYVGSDSFTYKASDGQALSNTATISLTVGAAGLAPVANNDAYTVVAGHALSVAAPGVLANDSDPSARPLNAVLVSGPTHGTLTLNSDGSFVYTPAAGYTGSDSFSYRAADGVALSAPATVSIGVNPAAAPPVANNDLFTVTSNSALDINAPGVLGNDTDPNGLTLSASLVSSPSHGTLSFNSDGSFAYAPASGFVGTDSFSYQASDGQGVGGIATVTINVTLGNQSPVANPDTYNANSGSVLTVNSPGVLGNDTDPSGNPLTAILVSGPSHGSLTLNADGSFSYASTPGYVGTDQFSYRASDGSSLSNPTTVTFNVSGSPGPGAPVGVDDQYGVTEGTTFVEPAPGVLSNDSDPQSKPLTAVLVSNVTHGSLALNPDGSFIYVPTAGYTGQDQFTYQDFDGTSLGNLVTVSFTVNAAVQPIVANPDIYIAVAGQPLSIASPGVQANDSDPSGHAMTSTVVTPPSHGTLTLNADGSFSYLGDPDYHGIDRFTYRDTDGTSTSSPVTVLLAVNSPAALPNADDRVYVDFEGKTLSVPAPGLIDSSEEASGLTLTPVIVTQPEHGTITMGADDSFQYVPDAGFYGVDTFEFELSEGTGLSTAFSNVARARILVEQSPDTPVINPSPPMTSSDPSLINITVATFGSNDPNAKASDFTATIDWGDGTAKTAGTITAINNGFAVSGSHRYASAGSYTIAVSVTGPDHTNDTQIVPLQVVTDDALLTAELDPATDLGSSNTDYITNDTSPAFIGSGDPGDLITLYATLEGSSAQQIVGRTYIDGNGNFRVISSILPQGVYDFEIKESDPQTEVVNADWNSAPVTIDTTSPVVTSAQLIPGQGMILLTLKDNGSLDQNDLKNVANYIISRPYGPFYLPVAVTAAIPGAVNPDGTQTVRLILNNGQVITHGRFVLRVNGTAIKDIAGNALDGQFTGNFPSGTNTPGSDFVTKLEFNSYQVLTPEAVTYIPALHYIGHQFGLFNNHGSPYLSGTTGYADQIANARVAARQAKLQIMVGNLLAKRSAMASPQTAIRNRGHVPYQLARSNQAAPAVQPQTSTAQTKHPLAARAQTYFAHVMKHRKPH